MADDLTHAKTPPAAAAVIEGFPDPVVLIDSQRRVLVANSAAREILNVSQFGRDLAHSVRHPAVLNTVDEVLRGAARSDREISLSSPVQRDFSVSATRLQSGGPLGDVAVVLALQDMTGAKRAEQMRADFVANVSHELLSPLAALVGLIETLQSAARDDEEARDRFLDIMHGESLRMSRLIDDLLSLSRVEINEHVQPREGIDLRGVLGNVAELLAKRAEERGVTLDIAFPDDLPAVAGDRDQLFQVFQNLIDNAIKYGGRDKSVRIGAHRVERMGETGRPGIAVSIVDRGEGIDSEHLPRLTERFYRVDKGRSRSMGGTGLGLAIVKHIINRHRGHLDIESKVGQGATFTVTIPLMG